jgi:hypothetical protein
MRSPSPPPIINTPCNDFGLYRQYTGALPRHDPDKLITPDMLVDSPDLAPLADSSRSNPLRVIGKKIANKAKNWFAPFLNPTTYRFLRWQYTSSNIKSSKEMQRLAEDVMNAPDFNAEHFRDFSIQREESRLDNHCEPEGIFSTADGWREGSVKIRLPKEGVKYSSEGDAPEAEIKGIWYRPLRDLVKSMYEDETQTHFHTIPHKLFRQKDSEGNTSSTAEDPKPSSERVFSELYNSDAMLEEQAKINAKPRNPEDDDSIEYCVAPLMAWSDATHLTSFGSAYLWPFYIFPGSLSKYMRCKPSSLAAHHVCYAPKVCLSSSKVSDYNSTHYICSFRTQSKTHIEKYMVHRRLQMSSGYCVRTCFKESGVSYSIKNLWRPTNMV